MCPCKFLSVKTAQSCNFSLGQGLSLECETGGKLSKNTEKKYIYIYSALQKYWGSKNKNSSVGRNIYIYKYD